MVEHRDADGNPTLPEELIAGTFLRRYEEVPEGTEIKVLVLAGYKPKALMMVERKIYRTVYQLAAEGTDCRDGWLAATRSRLVQCSSRFRTPASLARITKKRMLAGYKPKALIWSNGRYIVFTVYQ